MLNALRKSGQTRRLAAGLYTRVVARAREPVFFSTFSVADTVDGRFDLLVLHAWLVLEALASPEHHELAQKFTDAVFVGFDEALREQGAGDIGMSRRMKKMAEAYYGRLQAYSAAKNETELAEAILRNVYRAGPEFTERANALARYAGKARSLLAAGDFISGEPGFGPLPELTI